ncbi:hypothetical protein N9Z14_01160 [Opitutales bacterium]|nr:hypothetical protein [Opitutales bacterium]
MNKIYDKLLLAVALLALLASVGFYVTQSGATSTARSQVGQPADNPYQAIPVPASSGQTAIWPDATKTSKQPPLELYDVFTPPQIWVDNDGTFIFKSPISVAQSKPPFGLYLAKFERDPYRIQMEGYIEEDLSDASKSLVLLFDEELQTQVRARVGQEQAKSEFKLVDFSIERVKDIDGNVSKVVTASLLDQRTGKVVVLKHGERLYNDTTTVVLRSQEDSAIEVVLEEPSMAFETSLGSYVLEEINLDNKTVTVTRLGSEALKTDPETQVLSITTPNEESEIPLETGAADEEVFDFSF